MQECLRVVKKEAKLGGTKLRHEEIEIVPRDKMSPKADKAWVRAINEDVSRSELSTAMWA